MQVSLSKRPRGAEQEAIHRFSLLTSRQPQIGFRFIRAKGVEFLTSQAPSNGEAWVEGSLLGLLGDPQHHSQPGQDV